MNKYITVAFLLFLFSCTNTKETTSTSSSKQVKSEKKGRKLFGEIKYYIPKIEESMTTSEAVVLENSPVLFFQSGEDYYEILIPKGDVSEEEMKGQMGKEIKIRGEILEAGDNDIWVGGAIAKDVVGYITIYEITPTK